MNKAQNEEWTNWAIAAQKGDKAAYHALLSDLSVYIRNVIVSGLANPDWADDVAQDVLVSIHKSLHTYSPDRPFKPWVTAIINFRRTDFLRKHYNKRQNVTTHLDDKNFLKNHVTIPAATGELKDIEAALNGLNEQQRKIFEMIKIQGYTAQEVAEVMGMSVSAVKVSAHRTQNKLKKVLVHNAGC